MKLEIVFMKHCAPNHALVHNELMITPGNLLAIFYQLTKTEGTSPNGFQEIIICKGQKLKKCAKDNNSKKYLCLKFSSGNLLLILYQLSQSLELLAVTVLEISSFLCPNFQREITKEKNFFLIFTR